MDIIKLLIEFFLSHGAKPIVFAALTMLMYVFYHLSQLRSIKQFKSGKFAMIWFVIATPQVVGVIVAEKYKAHLPVHQIKLNKETCESLRNNAFIKDQKCELHGRVLDDQNNIYLFQLNEQKLRVRKCDVLRVRIRDFVEYKDNFEHIFESTSFYDVMFGEN
ncbi:MAG: hypothetical protein HWE10_02885 [Gammaproteobacteria bacterium]|nr:hypothetical protein [Gammaproteobacteria bacterium]